MTSSGLRGKPIVVETLNYDRNLPYFFKNTNISPNIYIFQRAASVEHALYILDVWDREHYNVGEIDQTIEASIPHTIYLYKNNRTILKREFFKSSSDKGESDDMNIVRYKKDGKIYTAALLKFK